MSSALHPLCCLPSSASWSTEDYSASPTPPPVSSPNCWHGCPSHRPSDSPLLPKISCARRPSRIWAGRGSCWLRSLRRGGCRGGSRGGGRNRGRGRRDSPPSTSNAQSSTTCSSWISDDSAHRADSRRRCRPLCAVPNRAAVAVGQSPEIVCFWATSCSRSASSLGCRRPPGQRRSAISLTFGSASSFSIASLS